MKLIDMNTLVPISLVLTSLGGAFSFGTVYQKAEDLKAQIAKIESNITELRSEIKDLYLRALK